MSRASIAARPEAPDSVVGSAKGQLTSVDIYVTSQCDRRCQYCFLPADYFASGARMSLERFHGVVRWMLREGVREITLLGGEAPLHPSFTTMVEHAAASGLEVRVVTNGSRQFRRLLAAGIISRRNLQRVAVSLDTVDQQAQDRFRGRGAWRGAVQTIAMLRAAEVPFDINVTAVRSVLGGMDDLIAFAEREGARRVNIHWPSAMGLGKGLDMTEIPGRQQWEQLVTRVGSRAEHREGFFVEIERGFLPAGDKLKGCALTDFSNLEIMPDGLAYRCGLLVDQPEMASLMMTGDQLRIFRPRHGEGLLVSELGKSCASCPVSAGEDQRACIYDKVASVFRD